MRATSSPNPTAPTVAPSRNLDVFSLKSKPISLPASESRAPVVGGEDGGLVDTAGVGAASPDPTTASHQSKVVTGTGDFKVITTRLAEDGSFLCRHRRVYRGE